MSNIPQQWVLNEPSVVSESVEGEAIVINLETGCYYSLVGVAAEFWNFLQENGRNDQAYSWMISYYDAPPEKLRAGWDGFLQELLNEQLIREITPQDEAGELPPIMGADRQRFTIPQIHKFEDMKEMLLLDPIHDVAAGGWPNLPDPN